MTVNGAALKLEGNTPTYENIYVYKHNEGLYITHICEDIVRTLKYPTLMNKSISFTVKAMMLSWQNLSPCKHVR